MTTLDTLLAEAICGKLPLKSIAALRDDEEREKALHVFIAMLTDPALDQRYRAIKALGALEDRRAVEPLLRTLDDERDDVLHVFEEKFRVLVKLLDPEAIVPLLSHRWARDLSEEILKFSHEDLYRVLVSALKHPDEYTRETAVNYLGKLKDPRCIVPLAGELRHIKHTIRIAVIKALMHIGTAEVVPYVLSAVSDPDPNGRATAAHALGELGDPQAIEVLRSMLDEAEDERVRIQAACALGKLGEASGVDLILAFIKQRHDFYSHNMINPLKALKRLRHFPLYDLIHLAKRMTSDWGGRESDEMKLIGDIIADSGHSAAIKTLNTLITNARR